MMYFDDADESLDESWATNYKNVKKTYEIFYSDDVNAITISSIYINNNNEILQITSDIKELLNSNYLTQNEITDFIKSKMKLLNGNIKNICILKYNMNISPENVEHFLNSRETFNYLIPVTKIKDIYFEKTIPFFKDLNEVFILFYQN